MSRIIHLCNHSIKYIYEDASLASWSLFSSKIVGITNWLCSYRVRMAFISLTGQGSGGGFAPAGVLPAGVPPDCPSIFNAGFRFTMLSTPLPTSWKSGVPDFCEGEREMRCSKLYKAHYHTHWHTQMVRIIGNQSISVSSTSTYGEPGNKGLHVGPLLLIFVAERTSSYYGSNFFGGGGKKLGQVHVDLNARPGRLLQLHAPLGICAVKG